MGARAIALLLALAGAAPAALAATDVPPRRPATLFVPETTRDATLPPLLPPVHGIDVANQMMPATPRYRHANPETARGLRYDAPHPKSRAPKGRRGVGYPIDAIHEEPVAPWDAKFVGGLQQSFDSIDFDTNGSVTSGNRFIPPDSSAAVSPTHVVTVTNVAMRIFDRNGTQIGQTRSLKDFFASLGPETFTFDPKVVWDEHGQRFVLVALEQTAASDPPSQSNPNPTDTSFILLAATSGTDPTATWFRTKIDSKRTLTVGGNATSCWGDYPGFGFDEQAVYVSLNMFSFATGDFCGAALLWIVEKGTSGGFYQGGTAVLRQIDPYGIAGAQPLTTQVARMRGTQPSGGVGTFLVGHNGLSDGTNEFIQVARIDNPATSSPDIVLQDFNLGNVSSDAFVPLAPQPSGFLALDAGDKRTLDAAWRANRLYTTFTHAPSSGVNVGEATAHWAVLDTTRMSQFGSPPPEQQGDVGGEQLGANTHTYYPAIDVNALGHVVVGFSASNSGSLEVGAYAVSRRATDANGTMSAPLTIHAGVDPYLRTFGDGNLNRWGDYSSVAIDPGVATPACFWVYNQWAAARGTSVGNEDGRWATTVGRVCVCDGDEASGDTDGDGICNDRETDLAISKTDNRTSVNAGTSLTYTIVVTNVGGSAVTGATVNDTFPGVLSSCSWTCSASAGGSCGSPSGNGNIAGVAVNVAQGGSATFSATCSVPSSAQDSTLSNTASVTHPFDVSTGNNSAVDTTQVVPRADLRITKTDSNNNVVNAGSQVTWTIVASNLGSAASGGTVTDNFAAPQQSCTWTCSAGSGSVCPSSGSGNLAASVSLGGSGSVTFTARCTVATGASGTLANTATIAGLNDPDPSNNTASDTNTVIRPSVDVSVTKSDGVTQVDAGTNLAYTIAVRNNGSATASGVTLSDPFPAPITSCAWTCSATAGGTCNAGSGAALSDTLTLPAGSIATYIATCAVPAAAAPGTIVNTATVAYANDPSATNNVATDGDTVVRPRADVSISKSDGISSIDAGRNVAYTIVVTNPSANAIAGVLVTDTFAAPLTACRWTCSATAGGSCSASGTGNIANGATLGAGGTATYVATCLVPLSATGTLSNTATVAYGNDPSAFNNSASDTNTQVVPPIFADGFE